MREFTTEDLHKLVGQVETLSEGQVVRNALLRRAYELLRHEKGLVPEQWVEDYQAFVSA